MVDFRDVVHKGCWKWRPTNLWIEMEVGSAHKDNNKIFGMEKHDFSHSHRRILLDAFGNPICTLHKQLLTVHGRWEVYKDDNGSQLSFIVKRSSVFTTENKIVLDVFLANNTNESVCKVQADLTGSFCEISAGGSILAKANNENMGNKNAMKVWIKAKVDLAFIVAILNIVDEIRKNNKLKKVVKQTVKIMSGVMPVVGTILGVGELFGNMT